MRRVGRTSYDLHVFYAVRSLKQAMVAIRSLPPVLSMPLHALHLHALYFVRDRVVASRGALEGKDE